MILKSPSENILKKKLDFSNKIRHFSSKQASKQASKPRGAPGLCKIRESTFIFLRRSFSAIAA